MKEHNESVLNDAAVFEGPRPRFWVSFVALLACACPGAHQWPLGTRCKTQVVGRSKLSGGFKFAKRQNRNFLTPIPSSDTPLPPSGPCRRSGGRYVRVRRGD